MLEKIKNTLKTKTLFICGIVIGLVVAYLDQITKLWAVDKVEAVMHKTMGVHQAIKVTDFFNLVRVQNTGVSFGMFSGANNGNALLLVATMIITSIVVIWMWKNSSKYIMWALAFVFGGAIGNIIDRIQYGAVSDFLDFHLMGYHWPSFNLADAMITIGVIMIALDEFFFHTAKKSKEQK